MAIMDLANGGTLISIDTQCPVNGLSLISLFDWMGWISHDCRVARHIFHHHSAGSDNCAIPNNDVRADERIRRNPCISPNRNGRL